MGCGASKPANTAALFAKDLDKLGPLPELEWAYRPIWGQYIEYLYAQAKKSGSTRQLRENFSQLINSTAKEFLGVEYPECAKAGTTEDMGDDAQPFGGESRPCVPTKTFITLDEGFNGIMYAATLVVNSPMAWKSISDATNSALPGSVMDAPETKLAQRYLTFMITSMEKKDADVKHCVLNVIVGSVMMSARYKPHNLIPSMAFIGENTGAEIAKPEAKPEQSDAGSSAESSNIQLAFRSRLFMSVLKGLDAKYPGCTIWDAGDMDFKVDDKAYPHPARLLICRDFERRNKDVETFDFKVKGPDAEGNETMATILRARVPSEDPGGIVCLTLVINVDSEDPWPKRDMKRHERIIQGAFAQLSVHGMIMSFLKGFERCAVRIWAGQDTRHFNFITPHTKGQTEEHVQQFSELLFGGPVDPLRTAAQLDDATDLEQLFGVEVKKQTEHKLWQSESQFQKIRHDMRQRAKANPEQYEAMAIMTGNAMAARFMQRNFGDNNTITEEGELPQPDLKDAAKFSHTKLLVARDPKQEPNSITAVLVSIPCPVPGQSFMLAQGKTWLDTPEIKRAEDALMAVLKKWYSEGKISKVDCYAQVMMSMDATIYQFVEGSKFIDYPDERMEQLEWE